jgi:hypothetical protein
MEMLESGKRAGTRCCSFCTFIFRTGCVILRRSVIWFDFDRFNEIWRSTEIFTRNARYNLAAKCFVHSSIRRLIIIARRLITFSFCLSLSPSVSFSPWKSIFLLLSSLLPLGFSAISSSRENISFEQRACRPDFYYKCAATHTYTTYARACTHMYTHTKYVQRYIQLYSGQFSWYRACLAGKRGCAISLAFVM